MVIGMRLIDADAMIDRLKEWDTNDNTDKALYNFTLNRINEQPSVNAQPERHGYWIHWSSSDECSLCSYNTGKYSEGTKFCPNCGAIMDAQPIGYKFPTKIPPDQFSESDIGDKR